MPKSPEQRILELEAKVKLLEKQKAQLEDRIIFQIPKSLSSI